MVPEILSYQDPFDFVQSRVARREVAQASDVDGSFGHVSAVSQVPSVS